VVRDSNPSRICPSPSTSVTPFTSINALLAAPPAPPASRHSDALPPLHLTVKSSASLLALRLMGTLIPSRLFIMHMTMHPHTPSVAQFLISSHRKLYPANSNQGLLRFHTVFIYDSACISGLTRSLLGFAFLSLFSFHGLTLSSA